MLHPACALSVVDVYDVSLRSICIHLPQCCCSVHANNPFLHSTFSRRMRIQSKNHRAGGKPQSHLFFGAALDTLQCMPSSTWCSAQMKLLLVLVIVGSPVTLRCGVSGYPVPAVSWISGTSVSVEETVGVEVKEDDELLIIKASRKEHTNSYTCIATNRAGQVSRTSHILVGDCLSRTAG